MKLSIDRAALLRALGHVQSVVERRNTIPILGNVLVQADRDLLRLTTTDMDMEIEESVPAKVERMGETTIPAQTLFEIVRKLPDGVQVELSVEPGESQVQICSGRSKFRLGCLPVADFPQVGESQLPIVFHLPASTLRALIDRTKIAMSVDDSRFYLNGIHIHGTTTADGLSVLRAVSTDGHRLARFEIPLPEGAEDMPGIIISRKAITEVRKLAEEVADSVEISLAPNKVRFAFDHIVLITKLVDGRFPEYERVIPKANHLMVDIDHKIFGNAVERVAIVSDGKTRSVRMSLQSGTMTLSASAPDSGSAVEEIEIDSDSVFEAGFNSKYLLDFTNQIEGRLCRLRFADSSCPTIFEDPEDPTAIYVLMPLRI